MKSFALIGCLLSVVAVTPASATSSTYTDVAACGGYDTHHDEFLHYCNGPAGLAAVLHYIEGKAFVVFGNGSDNNGGEIVGDTFNPVIPILVGTTGMVFGPKIEWVKSESGKVCAAIVRVQTNKGSRLVVTALDTNRGDVAMTRTNDQARESAKKLCASDQADVSSGTEEERPANTVVETAARTPVSGNDLLP